MKFSNLAVVLIAISIGTSAYYHVHIQTIKKNISLADETCFNRAADVGQGYKTRINELLTSLPEQQEMPRYEAGLLKKTKLDSMVSYGHQVRAVSHKYEFLLESAQIDEIEKMRLRRLLIEREMLSERIELGAIEYKTTNLGDLHANLVTVEESIEEILKDPIDYDRYSLLKEKRL